MVMKVWRQINAYWHLITGAATFIVLIILWAADVSSYGEQIQKNKQDIASLKTVVSRTDKNVQMIADKLGIKPLKRTEGIE